MLWYNFYNINIKYRLSVGFILPVDFFFANFMMRFCGDEESHFYSCISNVIPRDSSKQKILPWEFILFFIFENFEFVIVLLRDINIYFSHFWLANKILYILLLSLLLSSGLTHLSLEASNWYTKKYENSKVRLLKSIPTFIIWHFFLDNSWYFSSWPKSVKYFL